MGQKRNLFSNFSHKKYSFQILHNSTYVSSIHLICINFNSGLATPFRQISYFYRQRRQCFCQIMGIQNLSSFSPLPLGCRRSPPKVRRVRTARLVFPHTPFFSLFRPLSSSAPPRNNPVDVQPLHTAFSYSRILRIAATPSPPYIIKNRAPPADPVSNRRLVPASSPSCPHFYTSYRLIIRSSYLCFV